MPLKITKTTDAKAANKPKFFVGGTPATFEITNATGTAKLRAQRQGDGTSYALAIGSDGFRIGFTGAQLREIGEHLTELAGIMDGSIKVAA